MRESFLLAPSGCGGLVHATLRPPFSQSLYYASGPSDCRHCKLQTQSRQIKISLPQPEQPEQNCMLRIRISQVNEKEAEREVIPRESLKLPYRGANKGLYVLLSRTQAGPGRTVKQEQEEISRNHVQTFICLSVHIMLDQITYS